MLHNNSVPRFTMYKLNKNALRLIAALTFSLWVAKPVAAQVSSNQSESTKNKASNGTVLRGASSKDSAVTKSDSGTKSSATTLPKGSQTGIDYGGNGALPGKLSTRRKDSIKEKAIGPTRLASWIYQAKSYSGEFRHERDGSWGEYQNGKRVFTLRETNRDAGRITLFDDSRGLRVMLYLTKAIVYRDSKVELTYTGGWQYKEWVSQDGTTRFVNTEGKKWVEYRKDRQVFTFEEKERFLDVDRVKLFDPSRGFYVWLMGSQSMSGGFDMRNQASVDDGNKALIQRLRGTFTQ